MRDFDLLLSNARVISGTGNPWFRADVGIRAGRIATVGRLEGRRATRLIKADELFVAPGFIDTHSHYGLKVLQDAKCEPLVRQGITTALYGQDGFSAAPVDGAAPLLRRAIAGLDGELDGAWPWRTFGEYLTHIAARPAAINSAALVGHGTLRLAAAGFEQRKLRPRELATMTRLAGAAMKEGAFGLSTGLIYPPSMYGDTEELIAVSRVVAEHGGIYVSHIRGEGAQLVLAVEEALRIGRRAGLPVHISHHKAIGAPNWGRVTDTVQRLARVRQEGWDVTADQYPYTAGSTTLTVFLPPWALAGGTARMLERLRDKTLRAKARQDMAQGLPRWEGHLTAAKKIIISYCKKTKAVEGRTLDELARQRETDLAETIFDLLLENEGTASCVTFHISEDDVRTVMRAPFVNVCTDGLIMGRPHPRVYGTYPRVLARYVREEGVLSLEEAIRKMTSLPAQRLGLADRGTIQTGMWADLVVFDAKQVLDRATYEDPFQYPEGIPHVLVNGEVVVERGEHTGARPGQVLRHVVASPSP
jgi:N-acyl-D-amino-acid deacylase